MRQNSVPGNDLTYLYDSPLCARSISNGVPYALAVSAIVSPTRPGSISNGVPYALAVSAIVSPTRPGSISNGVPYDTSTEHPFRSCPIAGHYA
ncbi:hypothetical protein Bpfe_003431 [Biomphalaria pfeifferi]|uniref:Uncharacterized protein n=1 Tax=Biomphalaria pfeifferi TaxID=112525 RepID=A0AAD8C734_BIOPF|nr:hypothetical protein Bpfe_003431 [Biomphalaria pfeifferi]